MTRLSPQREQLLAHVHSLIASGGFKGLDDAEIFGSGETPDQVNEHAYPDKITLLRAFVAHQRDLTETWINDVQVSTPDPLSQLRRYVDEWAKSIDDVKAPFCICALLAAELPILPGEAASDVRAYFHRLSGWIASAMTLGASQGRVRLTYPPEIEATIFMATVQGAMLSARAYGEPSVFYEITGAQLARF